MRTNAWFKLASVSLAGIVLSFILLWGIQQFNQSQLFYNVNTQTNGMNMQYNGGMGSMAGMNMGGNINMQGNMNMQGGMMMDNMKGMQGGMMMDGMMNMQGGMMMDDMMNMQGGMMGM